MYEYGGRLDQQANTTGISYAGKGRRLGVSLAQSNRTFAMSETAIHIIQEWTMEGRLLLLPGVFTCLLACLHCS